MFYISFKKENKNKKTNDFSNYEFELFLNNDRNKIQELISQNNTLGQDLSKKKAFQIKTNKNFDRVLENSLNYRKSLRSKAECFKENKPSSFEQSLTFLNNASSQNFGSSERVISRSGHIESGNNPKITIFQTKNENVSKSDTMTNFQTNVVHSIRTCSLEKPIKINKNDKEFVFFKNKVIEMIKSNSENSNSKTENNYPILVSLIKSGKSPTGFFLKNKLKHKEN